MKTKFNNLSLKIFIILGIGTLFIFIFGFFLFKTRISSNKSSNSYINCSKSTQKPQCLSDLIDLNLKTKGIESTFKLLANLYKSDPVFASNCHAYAHQIGKAAYQQFLEHKNFIVSRETSFCGFGFYHAFMETLLETSGDLRKAREFCAYVDSQLSYETKDAGLACYHGIGHGTVDFHNPKLYKDELDLIREPIELCKKVSENNTQLNRCASGIFNAVAIEYNNGKFSINRNNPLWLCRKQEDANIRIPCYEQMNTSLMQLAQNNFLNAARYIEEIENNYEANLAMDSLASWDSHFYTSKDDFDFKIKECFLINNNFSASCVKGFAVGLAEFGVPGEEYIKSLVVCKNKLLSENQANACYTRVLNYLNGISNKEKMLKICNYVDKKYSYMCPIK